MKGRVLLKCSTSGRHDETRLPLKCEEMRQEIVYLMFMGYASQ